MRRVFVGASYAALAVAFAFACDDFETDAPSPSSEAGTDALGAGDGDIAPQSADAGPVAVLDDAGPPINSGECTNTMPFVGFASLGSDVNGQNNDHSPRLTADELTLYLGRITPGNNPDLILVRFRRSARDQQFKVDTLQPIFPGNTVKRLAAWPAADGGGRFYFDQLSTGNPTTTLVYKVFSGGIDDVGKPVDTAPVTGVSLGTAHTVEAYLPPNESEIWFTSDRNHDQYDIFHGVAADGGGFTNIAAVDNINTGADDRDPVISADGLTMYFASASGRNAGLGIHMATRPTPTAAFSFPMEVPGLAPLQDEAKGFSAAPGWISPDNCRLYLNTNFDETQDIYVAWRK